MPEPFHCMQAALAELEKACPGLEDDVTSLRAAIGPAQPMHSAEAAAKRLEEMRQILAPAQSGSTAEASDNPKDPPPHSPVRQPAVEARPHNNKQQVPQAATSTSSSLAESGVNAVDKRQRTLRHVSEPARGHQHQTSPAASASLTALGANALVKGTTPPWLLGGPAKGHRAPASIAKFTAATHPDARRRRIARGTRKQPAAKHPSTRPCNVPAVPKACERQLGIARSQQESKAHAVPMSPSTGPAKTPAAVPFSTAHTHRAGKDSPNSNLAQYCGEDAAPPGEGRTLRHSPGAAAAPESQAHGTPKSISMRKRHRGAACFGDSATAADSPMGKKMRAGKYACGRSWHAQANGRGETVRDKATLRPAYAEALLAIPHRLGIGARRITQVQHLWGVSCRPPACTSLTSGARRLVSRACMSTHHKRSRLLTQREVWWPMP